MTSPLCWKWYALTLSRDGKVAGVTGGYRAVNGGTTPAFMSATFFLKIPPPGISPSNKIHRR